MRSNWTCEVCGRHSTLGRDDSASGEIPLSPPAGRELEQAFVVRAWLIRCPNPDCHAPTLTVRANYGKPATDYRGVYSGVDILSKKPAGIGLFQFLPTTSKPLSATVPGSIKEDYSEAYLIRGLSPKASATLARRALQGMIRDFWSISKATLAAELKAIKDTATSLTRCPPRRPAPACGAGGAR